LASGHGVEGVERLPGNKNTSLDCYKSEKNRAFAEAVTGAMETNTFYFDGGDLMPPAVGQGTFWEGMVEFARGMSTADTAALIDSGWPS
jgi:alpha-glucoside transport system substrate-binding protein